MLSTAKQKKLDVLFKALPEDFLRQLQAACEAQYEAEVDGDDMPWDVLSDLARNALAQRGVFVPMSVDEEEDEGEAELSADIDLPEDLSEQVAKMHTVLPQSYAQGGQTTADFKPVMQTEEAPPLEGVEAAVAELEEMLQAEPIVQDEDVTVFAEVQETALRPRNAMHAFFLPFEALIVDPPKMSPRVEGCLCSTYLPAIWRLIIEEQAGSVIRDGWVRFELAADDSAKEMLFSITQEMHAAALKTLGSLIERADEGSVFEEHLKERLRGDVGLADLHELYQMLGVVTELKEFGKTLTNLSGEVSRAEANKIYTTVVDHVIEYAEQSPHLALYAMHMIIQRLEEPTKAVRIYDALRLKQPSSPNLTSDIVNTLPSYFRSQLQDQMTWLKRKMKSDSFDASTLNVFDRVQDDVTKLIDEIAGAGRSDFTTELTLFQRRTGQVFEQILKNCQTSINNVLPLARKDVHGTQDILRPDIHWIQQSDDAEAMIDLALTSSEFLARSLPIAENFHKVAVYERVNVPVCDALHKYAIDLAQTVGEVRGENRLVALQLSDHIVEMARLLLTKAQTNSLELALQEAAQAA